MASTGEVWKLGHRPALDGVRGIAILLVLLQHVGAPLSAGGGVVGVTMFFTLSGFLITALLLQERQETGRVSLRRFYWRRTLRLVPALLVCVAVVTLLASAMGPLGATFLPLMQSVGALTYTSDFMAMWAPHQPYAGALNSTWSLAVEEKFYLLWPLALVLVPGRKPLVCIAAVGVVTSTWLRFDGWNDGAGHTVVQYGPHTHAGSLLIGCLLALYLVGRPPRRAFPRVGLVLLGLAGACSVVSADHLRHVWLPTVVPVLVAGGLWALVRGGQVGGPLFWRPLAVLGQRSYGFYLWHWPVALLMRFTYGQELNWMLRLAIVAMISWRLTLLSWRYVETPFLKMKGPVVTRLRTECSTTPRTPTPTWRSAPRH